MLSFMTVELIRNSEQNEQDVNQQEVGVAGMGKHGCLKTVEAQFSCVYTELKPLDSYT